VVASGKTPAGMQRSILVQEILVTVVRATDARRSDKDFALKGNKNFVAPRLAAGVRSR
jgi:hypothetical protein